MAGEERAGSGRDRADRGRVADRVIVPAAGTLLVHVAAAAGIWLVGGITVQEPRLARTAVPIELASVRPTETPSRPPPLEMPPLETPPLEGPPPEAPPLEPPPSGTKRARPLPSPTHELLPEPQRLERAPVPAPPERSEPAPPPAPGQRAPALGAPGGGEGAASAGQSGPPPIETFPDQPSDTALRGMPAAVGGSPAAASRFGAADGSPSGRPAGIGIRGRRTATRPARAPAIAQPATPIDGPAYIDTGDDYPEAARDAGIEGKVRVSILVDPRGRVQRVELVHGLGYGLDERALDLGRKIRFKPARDQAGRAVACRVSWTFNFALR